MILCLCVDNRFGIAFNNRRQSSDKVVLERLLSLSKSSKLWIKECSEKLFEPYLAQNVFVTEDFLKDAGIGDYCFAEIESIDNDAKDAEKIILFKWNRDYPYDVKAQIDFENDWTLLKSEDFKGHSHELITVEEYVKKQAH